MNLLFSFKSSVNDAFLPLDSLLQDYSEKELISGGVGLVYNKGDILYHNAFGYRDIEKTLLILQKIFFVLPQ